MLVRLQQNRSDFTGRGRPIGKIAGQYCNKVSFYPADNLQIIGSDTLFHAHLTLLHITYTYTVSGVPWCTADLTVWGRQPRQ